MHMDANMATPIAKNLEAKSRRRLKRTRQEASDPGNQAKKLADPERKKKTRASPKKKTTASPEISLKESVKTDHDKKVRKVKDVAVLLDWIIKPLPDIRGVCVEGQKEGMEDFWHTSAIVEAKNPKVVVTSSGSVYRLKGKLNKYCTIDNGFSKDVAQTFANGFPKNWKEIVQEFYRQLQDSISIVAECSPFKNKRMQKLEVVAKGKKKPPTSSSKQLRDARDCFMDSTSIWTPNGLVKQKITTHDVTITRSGRMSLPPLARWTGQQYKKIPGSSEIEVTFQTDHAKETLQQTTEQILQLSKRSLKLVYSSKLSKSFLHPVDTKPKVNENKTFDSVQNVIGDSPANTSHDSLYKTDEELMKSTLNTDSLTVFSQNSAKLKVDLCRELVNSVWESSMDNGRQIGYVKIPKIYLDSEQKCVNVQKSSNKAHNDNTVEICLARNSHMNSHDSLKQPKEFRTTEPRKKQNKTCPSISQDNKPLQSDTDGNMSPTSVVLDTCSAKSQKVISQGESTTAKKGRSKKEAHSVTRTRRSSRKSPRVTEEKVNEADVASTVAATSSSIRIQGNSTANPSGPVEQLKYSKRPKAVRLPHSLDQLSVPGDKKQTTKKRKRGGKDDSNKEHVEESQKFTKMSSLRKRRKVMEDKPEIDDLWRDDEKHLLQRALKEVNGADPDYWQKVSEIVQTRSEIECQQFHKQCLEEKVNKKTRKHPGTNPASSGKNGRKKGEPIRGGKGTLKRKQDLRNFLDELNDGYEDCLFDSTPLNTRKKASSVFAVNMDKNDSEIFGSNHNCITPAVSLTSTPGTIARAKMASLRKTPAYVHSSVPADTPVSINRRLADQYIKTFIDRKKKAGSAQSVSQVDSSILELSTLPVKSLFSPANHPSIVIDTCDEDGSDEGNPYMYYWDDESPTKEVDPS